MSPDTFFKINVLFFSREQSKAHNKSNCPLHFGHKKENHASLFRAWIQANFTYRNLKVLLYFVDLLE
jgi:hypothetical protein